MAELHTVGAPVVLASLLERLLRGGARLAEPGEFTGRAFLAGAMDLTAVEGVGAMIHAGSDAQLRAAEQLLHGRLAHETEAVHTRLVDLLALVEASIDFVEEPVDFIATSQAADAITAALSVLKDLLERSTPMERLDTRLRVLLAGPPNAGKSTLFNRLTGLDRSICSHVPGTTRDVITAPVAIGTTEVWLMDSAGVGASATSIELAAEALTMDAISAADCILWVMEGTEAAPPPTRALARRLAMDPLLVVVNKVDALDAGQAARAIEAARTLGASVIAVSAATGAGCAELRAALAAKLHQAPSEATAPIISLNARHRAALAGAVRACERAVALVSRHDRIGDVVELVALELREASAQLGAIVGDVTTEEVLARIFSRFCVGK